MMCALTFVESFLRFPARILARPNIAFSISDPAFFRRFLLCDLAVRGRRVVALFDYRKISLRTCMLHRNTSFLVFRRSSCTLPATCFADILLSLCDVYLLSIVIM